MTDKRDPRGIVNFFVRYLVLHMIFLVGLPLSYFADLALIYFFGFMGFFTFFQMLIAITKKFLEKAGSWKAVAIAGAVLSDVAVLWLLGVMLGGFLGGPSWGLVTAWLPYHFVAAFFGHGLLDISHVVCANFANALFDLQPGFVGRKLSGLKCILNFEKRFKLFGVHRW